MTEYYFNFAINQIKAAEDTLHIVKTIDDPSLAAVQETDVYRLRRGLCLPSATATCINTLLETRLIGETHDDAPLRIADLYKMVLPFHNQEQLQDKNGRINDKPWYVATPHGDMYHHTMMAISEGLGLQAQSIEDFENVEQLLPFLQKKGVLALSLNNRFVLDITLQNDPHLVRKEANGDDSILIDSGNGLDFRKFENGRHVVSMLGLSQNGNVLVNDSFRLPQMTSAPIMEVPIETINDYLAYHDNAKTRGIAFAKEPDAFKSLKTFENTNIFVPQEVVQNVQDLVNQQI